VLATPNLPVKVNASKTNGAVPQAQADKWARAYLREQSIELWAGTTDHESFIAGGCLGAPKAYDNLFGQEIANMQQAKAAGGHIEIDPLASLVDVALVPAPGAAADYVASLSGQRPRYALVS
jgi:hypothetical protein